MFISLPLTIAPSVFTPLTSEHHDLDSPAFFTLTYQGEQKEYTLSQLETLEDYIGTGGHLKQTGEITGPYEYTGVRILTLLNQFPTLSENYRLVTISTDGYLYTFTHSQIQGDVTVYDMNGNVVAREDVKMLLAYKEHGDYDFYGGPLRIAWVNDTDAVTDAPLWPKNITEIEIIVPSENDNIPPPPINH